MSRDFGMYVEDDPVSFHLRYVQKIKEITEKATGLDANPCESTISNLIAIIGNGDATEVIQNSRDAKAIVEMISRNTGENKMFHLIKGELESIIVSSMGEYYIFHDDGRECSRMIQVDFSHLMTHLYEDVRSVDVTVYAYDRYLLSDETVNDFLTS